MVGWRSRGSLRGTERRAGSLCVTDVSALQPAVQAATTTPEPDTNHSSGILGCTVTLARDLITPCL
jgi:hypothetical protein